MGEMEMGEMEMGEMGEVVMGEMERWRRTVASRKHTRLQPRLKHKRLEHRGVGELY